MPCKAIIFDLDGTLIDSAPDLRTACNKLLSKYERCEISLEETMQFVGNGATKLVERAFQATGEAVDKSALPGLTEEFLGFYDGHEADETQLFNGVEDTLMTLKGKGVRLALCTNKPRTPTLNLLRDLNLTDFFEVIYGGDDVAHKKPDPQMLHNALIDMGLEAKDCIMVGDSPNDIGAAKNAGMRNIAVSFGYRKVPVEDMGADHVVDRFGDITDLVLG